MAETAYYMSYVTRERHAIVDAAVASSIEALRMPEVALRLGEYASNLLVLLEEVTVPTIRDNKLRFDRSCEEKTSIVAVHPNETVFYNPWEMNMHRRQQESLKVGFGEESAQLMLEHYAENNILERDPVRINSLNEERSMACVETYAGKIGTNIGSITLYATPVMFIDANRPQRRLPNVVLHELTHMWQAYEYPVIMPEDDGERLLVEDELEAYYVEAEVIRGYKAAGRYDELVKLTRGEGIFNHVEFVDKVREMHQTNRENPFEANDRVLAALEANNINLG